MRMFVEDACSDFLYSEQGENDKVELCWGRLILKQWQWTSQKLNRTKEVENAENRSKKSENACKQSKGLKRPESGQKRLKTQEICQD